MRGREHYNFPAFFAAEAALEMRGYRPVNPARLDYQEGDARWDDVKGTVVLNESFSFNAAMRRDIRAITECDGIALLPGWAGSEGARKEVDVARAIGLDLYRYTGEGVLERMNSDE